MQQQHADGTAHAAVPVVDDQKGASGERANRAQAASPARDIAHARSPRLGTPVPAAAVRPPLQEQTAGLPAPAPAPMARQAAANSPAPFAPLVEQIVVASSSLRTTPSSSVFRMVLEPQTLGQVAVEVARTAKGLHVTLAPQHLQTGEMLRAGLPDLVAALHSVGVGQVQVQVDGAHVAATHPVSTAHQQAAAPFTAQTPMTGQGAGAEARSGQQRDHRPPDADTTPRQHVMAIGSVGDSDVGGSPRPVSEAIRWPGTNSQIDLQV